MNPHDDEKSKMILANLLYNSEYFIKVNPHMERDYFKEGSAYKDLYIIMETFFKKYEGKPTMMSLKIELSSSGLPENRHRSVEELLSELKPLDGEDMEVMIKMTEDYIKKIAVYNAMAESLEIWTNAHKPEETRDKRLPSIEACPDIIAKATSITLENKLGHDYNSGFDERRLSYLEGIAKIPFRLESLNRMTNGGVERKTLNIPIAPTGVGKSMFLCSLATDYIMQGYNVLYISLEMGEMQVSKRIDANILDISLKDLTQDTLNSKLYMERADEFMKMPHVGTLKVKEYASRTASINDFSALLDDYKIKENFVPDIIIVDYLMIMKHVGREVLKEHERLNRIAVELRALAFKYDVAVWSPMQTNRDGVDKSELSLSDIAGSFDVSTHADFIVMIIETENGTDRHTQRIKNVKNRYGSKDDEGDVELFVTKGKQRYEDMNDFNSSPPNEPPTLAFANPITLSIENGSVVQNKEEVEVKRTLSFVSEKTDEELLLEMDKLIWED